MLAHVPQFRLFVPRLLTFLIFGALSALLFASTRVAASPNANIIHVKPDAPDGNSGAGWDTARSLQSAIGLPTPVAACTITAAAPA